MKLGKIFKQVARVAVPVYGMLAAQRDTRKAEKEGMRQYEQQQSEIRRQGQAAQEERNKVASQRAKAEAKLRAGSIRANRRRVRGGLFGEGQNEPQINARLG